MRTYCCIDPTKIDDDGNLGDARWIASETMELAREYAKWRGWTMFDTYPGFDEKNTAMMLRDRNFGGIDVVLGANA